MDCVSVYGRKNPTADAANVVWYSAQNHRLNGKKWKIKIQLIVNYRLTKALLYLQSKKLEIRLNCHELTAACAPGI